MKTNRNQNYYNDLSISDDSEEEESMSKIAPVVSSRKNKN